MRNLKEILLFLNYLLLIVGFFSFNLSAQYRRRHADVTKELIKALKDHKPENYYFSLLPPDVSHLLCRMSEINIRHKICMAINANDKETVAFWGSFSRTALIQELKLWAHCAGSLSAARMFVSVVSDWRSKDLCSVAVCGYYEVLKFFLDHGADPNLKTQGRFCSLPPLYFAISKGHVECVKLLLSAGADVSNLFYDPSRNSPLSLAAQHNFYDIAVLLLAAKAKVNQVEKRCTLTELWYAARNNNTQMAKLFIEHGADVNVAGHCTILEEAAINGNVPMVGLLLDAGANPKVRHYSRIEYDLDSETKIKCGKEQRKKIQKLLKDAQKRKFSL
jgi:L-rhamnose mutarotase